MTTDTLQPHAAVLRCKRFYCLQDEHAVELAGMVADEQEKDENTIDSNFRLWPYICIRLYG